MDGSSPCRRRSFQSGRITGKVAGVFEPVRCGDRQLFDGALVNPVPVSVCRAYEQPLVVAVNPNYDLFGRAAVVRMNAERGSGPATQRPVNAAGEALESFAENERRRDKIGVMGSMADAFNIIQDRISRSRLAGDPPDLSLHPRVRDIGLAEFFRAEETIALGYEETVRRLPEIERVTEGYNGG